MKFEIKGIEPMGAVRMTVRSKFKDKYAQKYLGYKQFIKYKAIEQMKKYGDPIEVGVVVIVAFHMPIPKSLVNKVQPGQFHAKKPDIDNLCKGLFDALNGVVWIDDNRVVKMVVSKFYSDDPGITIDVVKIGGLVHGQAAAKPGEKKEGNQITTRKKAARKSRPL